MPNQIHKQFDTIVKDIVVAARRVFCFAFCQNAIQLSVKTDENGQWDTKLLQMDDHRAIYSKLDKKIHIGQK